MHFLFLNIMMAITRQIRIPARFPASRPIRRVSARQAVASLPIPQGVQARGPPSAANVASVSQPAPPVFQCPERHLHRYC